MIPEFENSPRPESPTRESETAFLLSYLQSHDVYCPLCHYNLRGLTEPRCPECGREIRLQVGMAEPYLLPWILTTIAVAMAAGVGLLFVIGLVISSLRFGFPSSLPVEDGREMLGCLSAVYCVVAIPLTIALIAARRAFFRLERGVQRALTIIAISIDAFMLLFLIVNMLGLM